MARIGLQDAHKFIDRAMALTKLRNGFSANEFEDLKGYCQFQSCAKKIGLVVKEPKQKRRYYSTFKYDSDAKKLWEAYAAYSKNREAERKAKKLLNTPPRFASHIDELNELKNIPEQLKTEEPYFGYPIGKSTISNKPNVDVLQEALAIIIAQQEVLTEGGSVEDRLERIEQKLNKLLKE